MKSIALIGFMGSGKSTIGPALAEVLGFRFVETDSLVEEAAGKSISHVFREDGEPAFRRLERTVVQAVTLERNQVISCGGGVTIDHRNLRLLRASCRIVLLTADPSVLYDRICASCSRPLAAGLRGLDDVERLLNDRRNAYCYHDLCVDTGKCSVLQAVDSIVTWVRRSDTNDDLRVPVGLGERSYSVSVGSGNLCRLGGEMRSIGLCGRALLFSNDTVSGLYADQALKSMSSAEFKCFSFLMRDGEEHKTLDTARQAYAACSESDLERGSTIVALGGGVVGDVAGFVAGTYMRGVNLVQVPTTLLAMVDSSIGGKTAVNMDFGKNMVGVFYQPRLVLIDVETLRTLSERDYRSGMVELVKHGLILNPPLLEFLRRHRDIISSFTSPEDVVYAVAHSCAVKADVVEADETDRSLREILNVGHTVGHALELVAGYGRLRHGEAVALGILAETEAASAIGLSSHKCLEQVRTCLEPLIRRLPVSDISPSQVCEALTRDKKKRDGRVLFSIIEEVGVVRREVELESSILKSAIGRVLASSSVFL